MSSRPLNKLGKTIGFRLTLLYTLILVLGACLLIGLTYFLLSTSLKEQDRRAVEQRIDELSAIYREAGSRALEREVTALRKFEKQTAFLIRFAGPQNETIILILPYQWIGFDIQALQGASVHHKKPWTRLPLKAGPHALEIKSVPLGGGFLLQVGKSTEARDRVLGQFRKTIAFVLIPLLLVGFVGGGFAAFRALRPIRDLIATVRAIGSGRMDARVPSPRTGDELDELVLLFNEMLTKIETLINGLRDALDSVAHDLRTPMTRLRGTAEMALHPQRNPEDLREALADCLEESERILVMLNTLMDISEAETGAMRLDLRQTSIRDMIGDAVDLYGYVAEEKGITIAVQCPEDLSHTLDAARMRQVVGNLLDNALKYTPGGGHIRVEARLDGEALLNLVQDNGVGIPPQDIPRIWDRLYRGDSSRSRQGIGLGLSLVRAIISAHRGNVEVSSETGAGSTFLITLPNLSKM